VTTGKESGRIPYPADLMPHSVAVSPDGRWVATGGIDPPARVPQQPNLFGLSHGHVKVWVRHTGRLHATLFGDSDGDVRALAFAPDGRRLYAATTVKTGQVVRNQNGLVGFLGAAYRCWDTAQWQQQWEVKDKGGMTFGLAVAPDGKQLAIANSAGCWLLRDAATGRGLVQMAETSE
jgi:WD40 repeat protein